MSTATEISETDLRAAWELCRRARPTWPETFEACMADPLIAGQIRITAKHPPRAATPVRYRESAAESLPHEQRDYGSWRALRKPAPPIDRKRLAAGDRDDD